MRTARLALALAVAGCAAGPGANPEPAMTPAESLAAAESAFAAHSVREGMRAAFMSHFADDGVFVREGWTVSNTYLAGQPNPPIVLDWRPVHVEVAASGDFGLSTGPWKITSTAKPDAPPAYGQFVSIWKREPGKPWRVAVDLGIPHPQHDLWDAPLRAVTRKAPATAGPVESAESAFAREAGERGLAAAYARHGAADLRLYRPGAAPALDKAQVLARELPDGRGWAWTTERSEVARSGDFAYTRGRYAAAGTPDKPLGWFLRVWRYEPPAWRVVLDVVNPAPEKK
jgi:ketosteroid isomerase-like protein